MKKGFTLTEVCITLGVVGAIAAMTIPAMVNRVNQETIIECLKKTAATLNQAAYNATVTHGGADSWNWTVDDPYTDIINNIIGPRLNIGYLCKGATSNNPQCNYDMYNMEGDVEDFADFEQSAKVLLTDGTLVAFGKLGDVDPKNCSWGGDPKAICGIFLVDTNGNKKPNTVGKDVFFYGIQVNGSVLPYGASFDDDFIDEHCGSPEKDGYTCAAKLTKDGWVPKKCSGSSTNCVPYPVTF